MHSGLLYISSMLNNRLVKLLTIYIALHIPLGNIFVKKAKYHEFQFCGTVANVLCNIKFTLQEYYITQQTTYQADISNSRHIHYQATKHTNRQTNPLDAILEHTKDNPQAYGNRPVHSNSNNFQKNM